MNDIEFFTKIYRGLDNKEDKERLAQAVETFKFLQAENEQFRDQADQSPLAEASASATVKVINSKTQMEWLFTARGHNPFVLLDRVEQIEKALIERGYIAFDAYVDQRRAERGETQAPRGPHLPQVLPVATGNSGNGGEILTFQAKTLVGSATEGKVYWKIKGGKFSKFGVNIWPEKLEEAGFLVDNLDPLSTYDLAGYTATYTVKDDGKTDKVIKLVK